MEVSRNGKETLDAESARAKAGMMVKKINDELRNMGVDPAAPQETRTEEERRQAQEKAFKAMLEESGIPDRFFHATLTGWVPEGPEEAKVKSRLYSWMCQIGKLGCPSFALQGTYGTGKTHLGCGILLDRFKANQDGLYTTAMGYTTKIKESYRKDSPEPGSTILERHAAAGLLVLDEIGRQFESEAEKLYLFDLMNERYNKKKPTLFLTNLSVTEFKAFIGDAITDRIREGGGTILELNWPSRRT